MAKMTHRQMAHELNEWYKKNGYSIQITALKRTIVYVDYSIVKEKDDYGIAPIYISKMTTKDLRQKYILLKQGLLK